MGRTAPVGIKDPGVLVPAGMLLLQIDELVEGTMGDDQKLVYQASGVVLEPEGAAGTPWKETFWIGTDEDPDGQNEATWVARAGRLKIFCAKVGVEMEGQDMDVVCSEVVGQRVMARSTHSIEPNMKKGQPNQYAGRIRQGFAAWFTEGEHEVGLSDEAPKQRPDTPGNGAGRAAAPVATRPGPKPLAPAGVRSAAPAPAARPAPARLGR